MCESFKASVFKGSQTLLCSFPRRQTPGFSGGTNWLGGEGGERFTELRGNRTYLAKIAFMIRCTQGAVGSRHTSLPSFRVALRNGEERKVRKLLRGFLLLTTGTNCLFS